MGKMGRKGMSHIVIFALGVGVSGGLGIRIN